MTDSAAGGLGRRDFGTQKCFPFRHLGPIGLINPRQLFFLLRGHFPLGLLGRQSLHRKLIGGLHEAKILKKVALRVHP